MLPFVNENFFPGVTHHDCDRIPTFILKKFYSLTLLLTLVVFLFFLPTFTKVFANENFESNYDVQYTISENGMTSARFAISLTNTSSDYYASSYKIRLTFDDINNVKASDSLGTIKPIVEKNDKGYSIDIPFNERVVGIGNTLRFTVTFDTNDIAQHEGAVWEINIPGLVNQEDFDRFTVEVVVPPIFGKPTYIKPKQHSDILLFAKEQLGKSGISIGFGDKQTYDFELTYHLKNQNMFPVRTEIAVPPTTNYQEIFLNEIEPKPNNIMQDQDGNWLADYQLSSREDMDVVVKGKAVLYLRPNQMTLSDKDRRLYTAAKTYWQTGDDRILTLTRQLKTPRAIYDYVVHALTYDIDRVLQRKERAGALGALKNPSSAVCLEFTDLFIALARAAGIPAREVDGFAYTQNSKQRPLSLLVDVLHAWPEYYDSEKQTWVMVDPTWGNTTGGVDYYETLDFDHLAFVIKGINSEYPIPAGGYKFSEDIEKKDVDVTFAIDGGVPSPVAVAFVPQFPATLMASTQAKGKVIIKNIGNRVVPAQNLSVKTTVLTPKEQNLPISAIPPYGFITVNVELGKAPILTNARERFTIAFAGKTATSELKIIPFFLTPFAILGGVVLVISSTIIFVITRKTWRLPIFGQRQENPLRGESQKS